MATTINFITRADYDLEDLLDNDDVVLDEFGDYTNGYICDVVSEIADNHIPIYNEDVWKGASDISEYIERAIEEGLAPVESRDVDLIRIFQSGYYVYYQEILYNNLDKLTFNYISNLVNDFLNTLSEIKSINISDIEERIEYLSRDTDNNKRIDSLIDMANDIIEEIKDGDFNN